MKVMKKDAEEALKELFESDFYKKKRKIGNSSMTDEQVWFLPVDLLIRRNEDDSIKEIIAQYSGSKLQAFAIRVKGGKLVVQ